MTFRDVLFRNAAAASYLSSRIGLATLFFLKALSF
jgi:hypothetical protein